MGTRKQTKKTGRTVLEKRRVKREKRDQQRVVERKRSIVGSHARSSSS